MSMSRKAGYGARTLTGAPQLTAVGDRRNYPPTLTGGAKRGESPPEISPPRVGLNGRGWTPFSTLKHQPQSADKPLWENLIPLGENLADAPTVIWMRYAECKTLTAAGDIFPANKAGWNRLRTRRSRCAANLRPIALGS